MKVFLSVDSLDRFVVVRYEGVVTDQLLVDTLQRGGKWLARHAPLSGVIDFTAVVRFEVTANTIRRLALSPAYIPDGYLRIAVAPQDEIYGMSRMFELWGGHIPERLHVVRTIGEAYKLMGVENPELVPVLDW